MKKQEVTIDINRLDVDDLKDLARMLYEQNRLRECKIVNERMMWLIQNG